MKKLYIVKDGTWLFGVHRTKKGAMKTKEDAKKNGFTGLIVKRRFDTMGYLNIQE